MGCSELNTQPQGTVQTVRNVAVVRTATRYDTKPQVSITEWFPLLPWTHNRQTSFLPLPQGRQPPCVLQGTSKMKIHGAAGISHSRR